LETIGGRAPRRSRRGWRRTTCRRCSRAHSRAPGTVPPADQRGFQQARRVQLVREGGTRRVQLVREGGGGGGGRSGFATAAPCCSAHLDFALHPLLRHKVVVHPVGLSAGTFCVKIDSTLSKKEAKSDLAAEKVLVSARLGTFGRALMRPGQRRFRFAGRAAKAGRLGRRAGGPTSPGRGSRVVCDTLKPTCSRTRPNAQAAAPPRQGSRAAPQPPPPSRTNWTRLVPLSRTNWTHLVRTGAPAPPGGRGTAAATGRGSACGAQRAAAAQKL
jgi:hypothetical protein